MDNEVIYLQHSDGRREETLISPAPDGTPHEWVAVEFPYYGDYTSEWWQRAGSSNLFEPRPNHSRRADAPSEVYALLKRAEAGGPLTA